MKRIFRSIINIKKDGIPTIPQEELVKNYKAFVNSRIQPEETSYIELWSWIEAHFREYKEVPSFEYIYEKALAAEKEAILANLKDISEQMPFIRGDYKAILKEKFETQNIEKFRDIIQKTYQVANEGLKIKKKEIKGIIPAIDYFTREVREFRLSATGIKTESDIRSPEDCKEVIEGYASRKRDPLSNLGLFTTIQKIDDTFKGIKPGELFIVAAYVAQGKSTFVAAMTYQAIRQGLNGLFISLEMPFEEMRDMFYVLHTTDEQWFDHPIHKKKYKDLAGKISFEKVRYGELSAREEEFFNAAAEDFKNRPDFGRLILIQPSSALTPSSLELEAYDRKSQLAEMGRTLDFIVVDYIGLMIQDKESSYGEFNIDLNNIIKRLKNLALTFDNGRGLIIITPFQVNREGWKDAAKNEGIYKLTALSNANESERSADGIISLFMSDEDKKNGIIRITCLKHRKGGDFPPFQAYIDFNSKRIYNLVQSTSSPSFQDGDMGVQEINNFENIIQT